MGKRKQENPNQLKFHLEKPRRKPLLPGNSKATKSDTGKPVYIGNEREIT